MGEIPKRSRPAPPEFDDRAERAALAKTPLTGVWFTPRPSESGRLYPDPAIAREGALTFTPPHEPHLAREELDIPLGQPLFFVTLVEPLGWEGYTFTAVVTDRPRDLAPTDATFSFGNLVIPGSASLVAYERCIAYRGTPVYLEMRWHPETGETIQLKGIEADSRHESVRRVHRGLKLVKALHAAGGRPPDIEGKATFWHLYLDAYQKVLEEKRRYSNKKPKKTEVAAEMLMSTKTLKRYRDSYDLPWPPAAPP
jgi:hypothetical protein